MPNHAKISRYTPETVVKMLKAFNSHSVKCSWKKQKN